MFLIQGGGLNHNCDIKVKALEDASLSDEIWDRTLIGNFWGGLKDEFGGHPVYSHKQAENCIPLSMWGDEGNALGESTMLFTWMAEVSKFKSTSWASRFLFTLVPASSYYKVDGINVTLECLLDFFVKYLNTLSETGLQLSFNQPSPVLWLNYFFV